MIWRRFIARVGLLLSAGVLFLPPALRAADVIELVNGDRYQGKVVAMSQTNIEFQSEVQGRLNLPRAKVAHITLEQATLTVPTKPLAVTNRPPAVAGSNAVALTQSQSDAVVKQMKLQGVDPTIVSQVQEQVLGGGSPEASQKFNEMMSGLMSGSLSVSDLRAQAQTSIAQINDLKKDLGDDAGDLLDGYLTILQSFVNESAPATNTPPAVVGKVPGRPKTASQPGTSSSARE